MSNRGLGFKIPGDDTRYNDAYTTYLMHFDGGNNTTYAIDYSGKQNGAMAVGGTGYMPNGTGKFGVSSMWFAGDTYAYSPTNRDSAFHLYLSDFTIDWWEYRTDGTVYRPSFTWDTLGVVYSPMLVGWGDSANAYFYASNDQANWNIASGLPMGAHPINSWAHHAIVRKGNTFYTFLNGVLQGTATSTLAFNNATYGPMLGCWPNPGGYSYLQGYIDEFRVSNGIARWTANFTPPSARYDPDPDLQTVLLLHFEGNQVDSSQYRRGNGTVTGNVAISTTVSKFGGTAAVFTGSPSLITYPASSDWSIGGGDFTIDCWVYLTTVPPGPSPYVMVGRMQTAGDWNNRWGMYVRDDLMMVFEAYVGGSYTCVVGTNAQKLTLNAWYHCAAVKHGNVVDVALNGIWGLAPFTLTGAVADYPSTPMFIGAYDANGTFQFSGYIDEVRITKGRALWLPGPSNTPFTPPTEQYNFNRDPTVALLHFDGDIRNSSQNRRVYPIPIGGNMVTTAAQSKFGGQSGLFDSTGYMAHYPSVDWTFYGADFTIDFWVFQTARQAADGVVSAHHNNNSGFNDRWSVRINPAGLLRLDVLVGGANMVTYPTATPVPLNAWTHCAIVRKDANVTFYINGVSDGVTGVTGGIIPATGGYLYVGGYADGTNKFNGYIDEFRITKGVALWTANFTPPTQPGS